MVGLLSMWMGFAVALQVRTQTWADEKQRGRVVEGRHLAARLIYILVGLGGMLGLASLIGDVPAFRGSAFPVGFALGIALFLLAVRLTKKQA